MDSIFVYKNNLVYNPSNLLFTIVQDSIRFTVLKSLAVYREENYIGIYRIVEKNVFAAGKLTEMLSLLVFGSKLEEGLKELKTIKVKGRMSDKTKMAFICLEHIKYEKKYSLQEEA
ncbi:hypothetical protein [Adhaeribacter rhizoryzae]|uniref:Uncharacterized protein n=1 Tax=Adhaeribacter rhizoryzae TaxID=2607907 RepID=A0A5M6DSB1_9BACT|nr:hypothetical protein [Adhaeribacter rhizoryzae]KAA5549206.1 hypothetical protein F0145_01030 [Adhaeribacter rhizoryzae]